MNACQPTAGPVVFIFNSAALPMARRIKEAITQVEIAGYAPRTEDEALDFKFDDTGLFFAQMWQAGRPIVGICASGILIRLVAPLLKDKRLEPPLLSISPDGHFVVPLLGGLTGASQLALDIAAAVGGEAVITASGQFMLGQVLEKPPAGYVLANPLQAKGITADLIEGRCVRLSGHVPDWLSSLPIAVEEHAAIALHCSSRHPAAGMLGLHYVPQVLVLVIENANSLRSGADTLFDFFEQNDFHPAAVGVVLGVSAQQLKNIGHPRLTDYLTQLTTQFRRSSSDDIELLEAKGKMLFKSSGISVFELQDFNKLCQLGSNFGRVDVIGLGQGPDNLITSARKALFDADIIMGYEVYVKKAVKLIERKKPFPVVLASGNRMEIERARHALEQAERGHRVAMVSSGDPGIFGMASALMEALEQRKGLAVCFDIEIHPGISAFQMASARLGAPFGHDFSIISLSDNLKPQSEILSRIENAAKTNMVMGFYNPASKARPHFIFQVFDSLRLILPKNTIVVLARSIGREGEYIEMTTLGEADIASINMNTLVIIGTRHTSCFEDETGRKYLYTHREFKPGETQTNEKNTVV